MFGPKTHCVVVVGAQRGDEGKGKIVDVLAERADLVVRYQGGANAGHTVDTGAGEFVLHQIPSGIIQGAVCVVGNGVVLDPETFFTELDALTARASSGTRSAPPGVASGRPTRTSTAGAAFASATCATSTAPRSSSAPASGRRTSSSSCSARTSGPTRTSTWTCSTASPLASCRSPSTPGESCTKRCSAASPCSWKGRRAPCSTSITAPIPT